MSAQPSSAAARSVSLSNAEHTLVSAAANWDSALRPPAATPTDVAYEAQMAAHREHVESLTNALSARISAEQTLDRSHAQALRERRTADSARLHAQKKSAESDRKNVERRLDQARRAMTQFEARAAKAPSAHRRPPKEPAFNSQSMFTLLAKAVSVLLETLKDLFKGIFGTLSKEDRAALLDSSHSVRSEWAQDRSIIKNKGGVRPHPWVMQAVLGEADPFAPAHSTLPGPTEPRAAARRTPFSAPRPAPRS